MHFKIYLKLQGFFIPGIIIGLWKTEQNPFCSHASALLILFWVLNVCILSSLSSLNFISYHCKPNEIKGVAQLHLYGSELHHPPCNNVQMGKKGLIIDLRNFARTDIEVIPWKLNRFAVGVLKTKPEKSQEKIVFFSQMLSIPCPLKSMISIGSHCLLIIRPECRKICYLSYLTVREMHLSAL